MKHTNKIKSCDIDNKQLAEEIGDLFYDSLSDFLKELSLKLEKDSIADNGRDRVKLSQSLSNASKLIKEASLEIEEAWKVCEKPVNDWFLEHNKKRK